ncbi:MAG: acyl-CoA dehydrogenase family protein [Pseudomonadota bacterium]|nr:acyl-CoA dehydrogenase family protein [Pseudomonadota bacterium]
MRQKINFYTDNPDIDFHLLDRLGELYQFITPAHRELLGVDDEQSFCDVWLEGLRSFGEAIGTEIAPRIQQVEEEELTLDADDNLQMGKALRANVKLLNDLGIAPFGAVETHAGMGAPFAVQCCLFEMLVRACPSTALNVIWYGTIAEIVDRFGSQAQKDTFIPPLASGAMSGCMALTEPETGSDLAAISSYGERQADGSYRLYGNKRFITNGTADLALVLARSSKTFAGLKHLSLFIVPRRCGKKLNYRVTKLEKKLGLQGSATCDLNFQGATAELLGEEDKGLSYMLALMNNARIATSYQGVGSLEAIYRIATTYAGQRQTWGKPIANHELIAEKLADMQMDLAAIRSLAYKAGFHESYVMMARAYLERNDELEPVAAEKLQQQVMAHQRRLRHWIPLIKYWVGEHVPYHARNALQIHGGYGYTKEYLPELWLRSTTILSIYEGTSQIQALMCMKDTLKDILRSPSKFIERTIALNVKGLSESMLRRKLNRAKRHVNAAMLSVFLGLVRENFALNISKLQLKALRQGMERLRKNIKMQDFSHALRNAERICAMKCHVALAESLVWDAERDPRRKALALRYLNRSLPRLACLKAEIDASSQF